MPRTGSQILICDLPVRFDTYSGCSHACRYCFVNRKRDIAKIYADEGAGSLENFIKGERSGSLRWCDWGIPIHFGGTSDPFQPIERDEKRTLKALLVLEKYNYPFVISTKNKMIADDPYLSIIKNCNVVVQISAICNEYNEIEKGASTFEERVEAIKKISPFKRVVVRMQPYLPQMLNRAIESIRIFAEAGAYGVTIEGMKYIKKVDGTIKVGGDMCYPASVLREHYNKIKMECHRRGMRFFCAENRLRFLGDDICCCGIERMGWKPNKGNLVHMLHGDAEFTKAQREENIPQLMADLKQKTIARQYGQMITFEKLMNEALRTKAELRVLIPEDICRK